MERKLKAIEVLVIRLLVITGHWVEMEREISELIGSIFNSLCYSDWVSISFLSLGYTMPYGTFHNQIHNYY